jgi:hypothetical protein
MALKYISLPKHPSEMSDQELRYYLGDEPDRQVMRSLLIAELEAIRGGAKRETRTMRNLWYSLIKPALSRAGILNKTTRGGRPVPWDRKLSVGIAELVRMSFTTYEELRIVDGSRLRQTATVVAHTVADVDLVGDHFPWVILFTEKDTMWGAVQSIAWLYGVSAISGGGEPSNACTENTIRAIARSETCQKAQPESIILLALTDYDPYGYKIANAQYNQIVEAVSGLDDQGKLRLVQNFRIGLEPEQLTPEQRQANAYEPKDTGLAEWYELTDGVDGKPLGLELDALPLSTLRDMFAVAIERHIDLGKRCDDLKTAYLDLIACELLLPDFNDKRRKLQEAIRQDGLGKQISETRIPGDLFRRAARAGWSDINPLDGYDPFGCADEIRETMREAMGA